MITLSMMSRRRALQIGAGSVLGIPLLGLPSLRPARAGVPLRPGADSCILFFLFGGPSQLETFDPKPDAPAEVRGVFGVTRTSVPGLTISDRLPLLAQSARRYALIRTCATSSGFSHHGGAYETLTGYRNPDGDTGLERIRSANHPACGAVVAKLASGPADALRYVQMPSFLPGSIPGQFGSYLGRQYDPFPLFGNPNDRDFAPRGLSLPADVPSVRLNDRKTLLGMVDRQVRVLEGSDPARHLTAFQHQAVQLLGNPAFKSACDLNRESAASRDRYGRNQIGQCCLLARRLVETNVKMVTITYNQEWDTHGRNFELLDKLLPPFDRALSALLEDLGQRGQAERTLVIAVGEFGRTPKINKDAGRDHWGNCYSALLAGGGVRGGQVLGESDRLAGYPSQGRVVTPGDLCATVYQALGIDPETEIQDAVGRPMRLTPGRPVSELL